MIKQSLKPDVYFIIEVGFLKDIIALFVFEITNLFANFIDLLNQLLNCVLILFDLCLLLSSFRVQVHLLEFFCSYFFIMPRFAWFVLS